ncbi:MAG: hypothetical protein KAI99_00190, partial [Cyclobacteriaceae bacterium]|nr:hypothetical protein [Cyclobacteriaceae bacterium]
GYKALFSPTSPPACRRGRAGGHELNFPARQKFFIIIFEFFINLFAVRWTSRFLTHNNFT